MLEEYKIMFDDIDTLICNKVHGLKIRLANVHGELYYLPCKLLDIGRIGRKTDFKIVVVASTSYIKN